ncbi:uncharacterized protein LOC127736006 [Mytilus californianus]|uniref:uncharacterized protein LOC127736006 n=1 Tax=Mytilus californianus TaxID=6549 RepID=UPI00224751E3|nr:uncharacterized protein LOC127736006 [Mytilus californianus]
MKTAAQRKKTSTTLPSRPSIPPNNATIISPDGVEELTNRITERVASRMERRMEEIFDKITSKGNNGNSDVQEAEVQHHVDTLNRNIQGLVGHSSLHIAYRITVHIIWKQWTIGKEIATKCFAVYRCVNSTTYTHNVIIQTTGY